MPRKDLYSPDVFARFQQVGNHALADGQRGKCLCRVKFPVGFHHIVNPAVSFRNVASCQNQFAGARFIEYRPFLVQIAVYQHDLPGMQLQCSRVQGCVGFDVDGGLVIALGGC